MKRLAIITAAVALAAAGLVAACRQGEGDRCQIDADCESPLICNQATQTCASTTGRGIDADVPEPPMPDAAVIDAPVDSSIDAPDAM